MQFNQDPKSQFKYQDSLRLPHIFILKSEAPFMLFSYISSVLFKRAHCCLDTSADIFCRGEIASYDIISRLLVSGIYGR